MVETLLIDTLDQNSFACCAHSGHGNRLQICIIFKIIALSPSLKTGAFLFLQSVNTIRQRFFKGYMAIDIKLKEYVLFKNRRQVVNLYKNFLILLEDLKEDGYNINDEKYQRLRKKILDSGNDSIRNFEEDLTETVKWYINKFKT